MAKRLVLLHSISLVAEMFKPLLKEGLPDVECLHMADEGIVTLLNRAGCLTPQLYQRIARQAFLAQDMQPDLILFTCSSTSPAVDPLRQILETPILKIDDALACKAVKSGKRIGVISTAVSALNPCMSLIQSWGEKLQTPVELLGETKVAAFEARMQGNIALHDQIVEEACLSMASKADVVVLAQASMAHLEDKLGVLCKNPVLASPKLCMEELRSFFANL